MKESVSCILKLKYLHEVYRKQGRIFFFFFFFFFFKVGEGTKEEEEKAIINV